MNLKTFVDERIAIEREYSTKLDTWSKKWRSRSDNCKAIAKKEDSRTIDNNNNSNYDNDNDNLSVDEEDETPGLFCILGSAGSFISPNTSKFIDIISGDVLKEIDTLLRELNAAIETGTKGVSDLWSLLKDKEAQVAKDYTFYKKNYKHILDQDTNEIMKLTDCFVRADSVGYLLVDDLKNFDTKKKADHVSSTSSSSSLGPSSPFASLSFSLTESGQDTALHKNPDTYQTYQQYCGSVLEAKNVLDDLESLVKVLGSNADSISSRTANAMKTISLGMTRDFADAWDTVITRHRRISEKLSNLYSMDTAIKSVTPGSSSGAVEEVTEAATSATENDMSKEHLQRESLDEAFDEEDHLAPPSPDIKKTNSKVIAPGDTDLFRPNEVSGPIDKEDSCTDDMNNNLSEEEKRELADFDFDALEGGGEFNLDTLPPLLVTINKVEILNTCSSEELNKSAMTRWDKIALILTDENLYVHPIRDELEKKISDVHTMSTNKYEIFKLILGVKPSEVYKLSDINVAVLLHPMYQDAFEVSLKSTEKRQIFLAKSTASIKQWIDSFGIGSEDPDGAVMASSTEL